MACFAGAEGRPEAAAFGRTFLRDAWSRYQDMRANGYDLQDLLDNVFLEDLFQGEKRSPGQESFASCGAERGPGGHCPATAARRPTATRTPDTFRAALDVRNYKAQDLAVKVTGNYVTVSGKHEEQLPDEGFVSRQFQRKFRLPAEARLQELRSSLGPDGVLALEVPLDLPQTSASAATSGDGKTASVSIPVIHETPPTPEADAETPTPRAAAEGQAASA